MMINNSADFEEALSLLLANTADQYGEDTAKQAIKIAGAVFALFVEAERNEADRGELEEFMSFQFLQFHAYGLEKYKKAMHINEIEEEIEERKDDSMSTEILKKLIEERELPTIGIT